MVGRKPAAVGPILAGAILVVMILAGVLAPWIAPHDPRDVDVNRRLQAPAWLAGGSWAYPLGTDSVGHDILSNIIYGSRVSLTVAGISVLFAGTIGITLGLLAGYLGGYVDEVLMRIIDIQLSFPPLLLAIALVAVLGAGLQNVVLVLVIRTWVLYTRIVRADVLSVREREYVAAARAVGARLLRILFRHVLPNVLGPSLVVATFAAAEAILVEAGLSFLGLGIPPPTPSWGRMISAGRGYIATAWWLTMIPGVAMLLSVLSINILGDWLRDRFDPRLQT